MKTLKKYLNPKSQWRKITEFPKKLNFDNILDFLGDYGFIEIPCPFTSRWYATYEYAKFAEKQEGAFYIFNEPDKDHGYELYFGQGGRISKQNPLIKITYNEFYFIYGTDVMDHYSTNSYNEIVKVITRTFKWI